MVIISWIRNLIHGKSKSKNDTYDEKVFIIGSMQQEEKIKYVAENIEKLQYAEVKYVKPQPSKPFLKIVSEVFDNIEESDTIIVVKKPDGSVGYGVTYEVEYARRLRKKIIFMD